MKNTYRLYRLLLSLALLTSLLCIFVPRHILADDVESRITSYVGQLELHSDNTATFTEEVTFEYDSSNISRWARPARCLKAFKSKTILR